MSDSNLVMNGFFCLCAFIFLTSTPTDRPTNRADTFPTKQQWKNDDDDDSDDNVDDDGFRLNLWDTNVFCALHFRDSYIYFILISPNVDCHGFVQGSTAHLLSVRCIFLTAFLPDQKWNYSMDSPNERRIKKEEEEKNWTAAMSIVKCVCLFWSFGFGGCHGTKWQREIGTNVEIYLRHKTS